MKIAAVKKNRMNAGDRKKQILLCATRLFGKYGYSQTQISDIQLLAKVSRGTIYQYFKNKDDIFEAVLEDLYSEWKKVLAVVPSRDSEEYTNGKKFFKHQMKITFKFFIDNPDYCSILMNIGLGVNESFDRVLRKLDRQMVGFIVNYIQSGVKLGRLRPDLDTELVSNILGGSTTRVLFYYVIPRGSHPDYDLDLITERFVDYISNGIFIKGK